MKNKKQQVYYFSIQGKYGTYILTKKEMEKALDRFNHGVVDGEIFPEKDYQLEKFD